MEDSLKTAFVDALIVGSQVKAYFLVQQVDRKTKKDGSDYLALKLCDRTGSIDAKLWAIPEGLELKAGDFVKIGAGVETYRDAPQLKIAQIRLVTLEDGIQKEDFIPASKHDRKDLFTGVASCIGMILNDRLRDAVYQCCVDHRAALQDVPAASKNHQAYLGGLLEHIMALCKLAYAVCDLYPDLNRDLLIAACVVHDIGKIEELTYDTNIGYTRRGSLVGHVAMSMMIWAPYAQALDQDMRDHLEHIIASHHGRREWRAVAEPMTREAMIFHHLDMIDSRYEMFTNALTGPLDADGFTPYIPAFSGALWNGKGK